MPRSQATALRFTEKEQAAASATVTQMRTRMLAQADIGQRRHLTEGPRTFESPELQDVYSTEWCRILAKLATSLIEGMD